MVEEVEKEWWVVGDMDKIGKQGEHRRDGITGCSKKERKRTRRKGDEAEGEGSRMRLG